jgi:hypothetical protein
MPAGPKAGLEYVVALQSTSPPGVGATAAPAPALAETQRGAAESARAEHLAEAEPESRRVN